jgi:hypothetical protein
MKDLDIIVKEIFSFLFNMGFAIENYDSTPTQFQSISLSNSSYNFKIHFDREYDAISILISPNECKHKFPSWEFFYVMKLINPSLPFGPDTIENQAIFMRENWDSIVRDFSIGRIKKTLDELDKLVAAYNKIRWKRKSK